MINSMRPNIWASLADEVPAWVSEKRNKTSVDRTLTWLDQCIDLNSVERNQFSFFSSLILFDGTHNDLCEKFREMEEFSGP